MQCVIIAAGLGRRIGALGGPKPLVAVGGTPLIAWVMSSMRAAGISDFIVVTGHRAELIEPCLPRIASALDVSVSTVRNEDFHKGNGLSVLAAEGMVKGPFLLSMADHIFEPAIVDALLKAPSRDGDVTLAVDTHTDNPLIDLDDVTRIRHEGTRLTAIGKGLAAWTGYDTGIFRAGPVLFEAIRECIAQEGDASLTDGMRRLAARRRASVCDIGGRFWIDVDDETAVRSAEAALTMDGAPAGLARNARILA